MSIIIKSKGPRTFIDNNNHYLLVEGSVGEVIGADGPNSLVDIDWFEALEDASGSFEIVSIVEVGVPLAAVVASTPHTWDFSSWG